MASGSGKVQGARTVSLIELVDAHCRVRAVLESDGENAVLTFYDEDGAELEIVRGVLPASAVLGRMLADSAFHPEIVGRLPRRTPGNRCGYRRSCRIVR